MLSHYKRDEGDRGLVGTRPHCDQWLAQRTQAPGLLAGSCPPNFQTVSGGKSRCSPCCRLCMFLSDPLCFLEREHSMVGSWPGLDSVPHLLRQMAQPTCDPSPRRTMHWD